MAFIKFLGTSGARFVMLQQIRASGGIWISAANEQIIIDPGPGALVRALSSRPKLDPTKLTGIILSHKHLDHSTDINVMIEAMTSGGHSRRGAVFAPSDALSQDPVILNYLRGFPQRLEILQEGGSYQVGEIIFTAAKKMLHPVETYGFNFKIGKTTVSFITDTGYFAEIAEYFRGEILVINVVLAERRPEVYHLSLPEVRAILKETEAKKTILTHFGRTMLALKPWEVAASLSQEFGKEVLAASDGMMVELPG